jgi:hypothetical protein
LARTTGDSPAAGGQAAIWVAFGLVCGAGLLVLCLWAAGRARLQRPDVERWENGEEPAWESPPLLAGLRGQRTRERPPRLGAPSVQR